MQGFKSVLGITALLLIVSGCASQPDTANQCGIVATYMEPDREADIYRVVVTHLDGKPVISQPNYRLSIGEHTFTVAELIDAPKLKVKLSARTPKQLTINVVHNQRYHIGAKFNTDKVYRGNDSGFWQPEVWQQEAHDCEFTPEL
ncbi:hypothetical protein [Shewanella sp. MBTL60-007]|uniref:hypothetical protein n=1 Tax=Shewanella sp. MBTL60-007 TaxID=2815911 RepID=UPI001C7EDE55|nr:hypothetical protein [Shewanella sp. MBTL60-007]